MRTSPVVPLLFALFLPAAVFGQSNPAFEVASVRPSKVTAGSHVRFLPGGRLAASSWLTQLIHIAYDVQNYQVSGGPDWAGTQWYTIEAKAANPNASRDEMRAMLRSLLADRFKLVLRREEKERPVYLLKAAKGGPILTPLNVGDESKCTRENSFLCGVSTPAQLAKSLERTVGRPVLDRTGATGRYDILLDFDVYSVHGQTPPPGYEKPSLASALREQLGLRLEAGTSLFPLLVVEKLERPGEN